MSVKDELNHLVDKVSANVELWSKNTKLDAEMKNRDVHNAFDEITSSLRDFAQRIEKLAKKAQHDVKSGEAQLQIHLGLMEAEERLEGLQPALEKATRSLNKIADTDFEGFLEDRTRLQAHLARMDAEDAIEARAKKAQSWLNNTGNKAEETLTAFIGKIKAQADEVFGPLNKS